MTTPSRGINQERARHAGELKEQRITVYAAPATLAKLEQVRLKLAERVEGVRVSTSAAMAHCVTVALKAHQG
jgi:hypothetical protein